MVVSLHLFVVQTEKRNLKMTEEETGIYSQPLSSLGPQSWTETAKSAWVAKPLRMAQWLALISVVLSA